MDNQTATLSVAPSIAPAQPTLDDLASAHLAAKQAVKQAQDHLQAINDQIVASVGLKDEGAFSVDCDAFKVTTTQPINRSVDQKLAIDLVRELPKDIGDSLFTWKPSVNLTILRELQKYQPETYTKVSKVITAKPGKPSVKIAEL